MAISEPRLRDLVVELVSRPGHEKVRALTYELLVNALNAPSELIDFERRIPEVRGRMDALLGQTVFEFKRDLRREQPDAEEEFSRYLPQRERETGQRFIGIATDGTTWLTYELRKGEPVQIGSFQPHRDHPRELVAWLESVIAVGLALHPDPATVRRVLGRESVAYARAAGELASLWESVRTRPSVRLKRQVWADYLRMVYGTRPGDDDLFLQHTYLTVVAKTMATKVLGGGGELPAPVDLLSGRLFQEAGINGAVESDFFDWVLDASGGDHLVNRIARQVAQFRLDNVRHDVLKGLYESLIDPAQRHDLGEYYTPDWLAERIITR